MITSHKFKTSVYVGFNLVIIYQLMLRNKSEEREPQAATNFGHVFEPTFFGRISSF
jgi:hypothetical protein